MRWFEDRDCSRLCRAWRAAPRERADAPLLSLDGAEGDEPGIEVLAGADGLEDALDRMRVRSLVDQGPRIEEPGEGLFIGHGLASPCGRPTDGPAVSPG